MEKYRVIRSLLVAAVLLGPLAVCDALAAQPANDDFEGAVVLLSEFGVQAASNAQATREPGEPTLAGSVSQDSVWFRWTPQSSGTATLYTTITDFDTVLGVFRGASVDALTLVDSNDDGDDGTNSLVRFTVTASTEYHVIVDGFERETGNFTLAWHLEPPGELRPVNDHFVDRADMQGDEGQVFVSSRGAGIEPGEPDGGFSVGGSVWWGWTPSKDGVAVVETVGSSFDTVLAVHTGDKLTTLKLVAVDDDGGDGLTSKVTFDVLADTEYQVVVAGLDGNTGVVRLTWSFFSPCQGPPQVGGPSPQDGDTLGGPDVVLRWGLPEQIVRKVIYGDDDRRELFEIDNPAYLELADGVVALLTTEDMTDNGDGTFTLPRQTYGQEFDLCTSEPFFDQPSPAWCTGFLVAPDIVITAGHCVTGQSSCDDTAFVFGFRMLDEQTPVMTIDESEIYYCREVIDRQLVDTAADWAVLRLDRPVEGHEPLRVRRDGKIPDGQSLIVIGHPGGLPAKIADNGRVRDNTPGVFFEATLDTYIGNSGSPVINADTLVVEGLLVRGEEDFVHQGNCSISLRCEETACRGEDVTRITVFDHLIPAHPDTVVFEVYFGRQGEELPLVEETQDTMWTTGPLEPNTTYSWRIVAKNECGATSGPPWLFSTDSGAATPFRRGDVSGDELLDTTDAIQILSFLFLGDPLGEDCLKSADVNDGGILDLTDAINLLSHLFLGTKPPAAPFGSCGVDPTEDELSCRSYVGCEP